MSDCFYFTTAILDIPIYKSRIQSLYTLFSLYSEFKNSQVWGGQV